MEPPIELTLEQQFTLAAAEKELRVRNHEFAIEAALNALRLAMLRENIIKTQTKKLANGERW